jgi:hypothetical protein
MAGPPGATPPDARIDLAALGPGSRDGSPSSRPSRSEPKGSTSFYVDYPEQPVAAEGGPLTFASAREQHGGLAGAAAALASRALAAWYGVLLMLAFFAVVLLLLGVFAFDPLPWEAWYTLAVTCTSLALLVFDALPIAITLLLCGVALNLSGVITDEQALVGFSNRGIASVVRQRREPPPPPRARGTRPVRVSWGCADAVTLRSYRRCSLSLRTGIFTRSEAAARALFARATDGLPCFLCLCSAQCSTHLGAAASVSRHARPAEAAVGGPAADAGANQSHEHFFLQVRASAVRDPPALRPRRVRTRPLT